MKNREIKFRLWNPDRKVLTAGNHLETIIATTDTEFSKEFAKNKMIWLQFTGLKDKNGKEIYEGDIVNFAVKKSHCKNDKCENDIELGINKFCPSCGTKITDFDFITTSKVVFGKGGFAYWWSNEESYYQEWQTQIAEVYIAWVEIIGNIYQNEELLAVKAVTPNEV